MKSRILDGYVWAYGAGLMWEEMRWAHGVKVGSCLGGGVKKAFPRPDWVRAYDVREAAGGKRCGGSHERADVLYTAGILLLLFALVGVLKTRPGVGDRLVGSRFVVGRSSGDWPVRSTSVDCVAGTKEGTALRSRLLQRFVRRFEIRRCARALTKHRGHGSTRIGQEERKKVVGHSAGRWTERLLVDVVTRTGGW